MDLEWNQPSYSRFVMKNNEYLNGEIIQFGAVKLSHDFRMKDTFSSLVFPRFYPKLTSSVRRLTGLTNWILDDAPDFPEAAKEFRDWCGNDFRFLIWGTEDIPMLRRNLNLYGLDTGWIPESFRFPSHSSCFTNPDSILWKMHWHFWRKRRKKPTMLSETP